ncbi:hypothetical protein RHGRI_031423 [Rhododendron griersonianum]|uniref:Uncharacterized protein n=1 Tax=Rhododendron griersonianum TaxID=479676 RepID=A0AAV6I7R8_9ERIC|nr:hypothetical protein RHGRI_031423 [Rhododendron griersonianum]
MRVASAPFVPVGVDVVYSRPSIFSTLLSLPRRNTQHCEQYPLSVIPRLSLSLSSSPFTLKNEDRQSLDRQLTELKPVPAGGETESVARANSAKRLDGGPVIWEFYSTVKFRRSVGHCWYLKYVSPANHAEFPIVSGDSREAFGNIFLPMVRKWRWHVYVPLFMFDYSRDRFLVRKSKLSTIHFNRNECRVSDITNSIFYAKGPDEVLEFFKASHPFLKENLFSQGFSVGLEDFFIERAVLQDIHSCIQEIPNSKCIPHIMG